MFNLYCTSLYKFIEIHNYNPTADLAPVRISSISISSISSISKSISISISSISSITSIRKTIAISGIQQGGVSLSLSLPLPDVADGRGGDSVVASHLGGEDSTGSNSEAGTLIFLGVKSRSSEQSRDFMDSSLKFSIVCSYSLVTSNSDRNREVGGGNLSLHLGDSVSKSGGYGSGSIRKTIAVSSVGKTVAVGIVEKSRVSLSLPLSDVVISGGNNIVVASHGDLEEGAGSNSQGSLAVSILLCVKSRGSEQSRDFMDSSFKFSIVSGNSLVASDSHRNSSIGSNHFSLYLWDSNGDGGICVGEDASSVEEGGVSFGGSPGGHCQQDTGEHLHCSSEAASGLTPC